MNWREIPAGGSFLSGVGEALRPPRRVTLSEWADENFVLSAESSAEPGPWKTIAYQRGIMDAITDPDTVQISVAKSARVGWTKIVNAAVAYYMAEDPCPILIVQPTLDDAKGYSKEEIVPMIRDVPALRELIGDDAGAKTTDATILHKAFPGGFLSLTGANSGRGFRRVGRRVVGMDEVDAYPASAGADGDPVKLAIRRTEYFPNRKIFAGSTPLATGASRIVELFEAGDQRRFFVPCPSCGYMDYLIFHEVGDRGHFMRWPKDKPAEAYFVCRGSGCRIDHRDKRTMLDRGEWRAEKPFKGHASFHVWAAYSLSPNATWGTIASEFVDCKKSGPEKLKTFVNTVLGETWNDRGDSPDWEKLFLRRESYPIASVPDGVVLLTAGVDVQKDRFVFEVVGWTERKESYSIDAGVLPGDTANDASWIKLDELLARDFSNATTGEIFSISTLAIDSGYATQTVYNWARRYPPSRVLAIKGVADSRTLVGTPTAVDLTVSGRRLQRAFRVWPIGVSIAKTEFYGWLRLPRPAAGEEAAPGYCHWPEYDEEYFRQITAEHLITSRKRNGFVSVAWAVQPGRENHYLDARIYARAAASIRGLDRHRPTEPSATPAGEPTPAASPEPRSTTDRSTPPSVRPTFERSPTGWISRGRGPWIGRK